MDTLQYIFTNAYVVVGMLIVSSGLLVRMLLTMHAEIRND